MANDTGAVNDSEAGETGGEMITERMRRDFERIDEMVRRSLNLRWRHLVTVDDVVDNQKTEILGLASGGES